MTKLYMLISVLLVGQALALDPELVDKFVTENEDLIKIEQLDNSTQLPLFEEQKESDLIPQLSETDIVDDSELAAPEEHDEKLNAPEEHAEILNAPEEHAKILNAPEEHAEKPNSPEEHAEKLDAFKEHGKTDLLPQLNDTKIIPDILESEDIDSSESKIKELDAALYRIIDFISAEFKSIKSSHELKNRDKREAGDDLTKYIYFIESLNDNKGEKNQFIADDLPDIAKNEIEQVEVAERAKKTPALETKEKSEAKSQNSLEQTGDEYRQQSNTLVLSKPNNEEPSYQESITYVQEMTENVESDVVEESNQPKYTRISRSSMYRLSHTVPYYAYDHLPQQMQYYFF